MDLKQQIEIIKEEIRDLEADLRVARDRLRTTQQELEEETFVKSGGRCPWTADLWKPTAY